MGSWLLRTGLCVSLCCASLIALAQAEAPAVLTLRDCIDAALAQQVDVLVGEEARAGSLARLVQARSAYSPQVALQNNTWLLNSAKGARDSTVLSAAHTLFDGGFRDARAKSARLAVEQADATQERTEQRVIYTVTNAYLNVLRTQHQQAVANRRIDYLIEQQKMVQARIDAGAAAAVDIFPIDAQLANARVDQIAARNSIRTASIQLQQAMGDTPGALTLALADIPLPAATPVEEAEVLVSEALGQRPEMAQQQAALGISQSSLHTAKLNTRPRPTVTAQLNQPLESNGQFNYALSAGINIDLYDGKNKQAMLHEAQSNLKTVELRTEQTRKEIAVEVYAAHITLTNARERMEASQASVTAAQRNQDAQLERYRLGLAVPLDLLNAQLEVTTAETSAVQAVYDYMSALAQLHYALGNKGEVIWENG